MLIALDSYRTVGQGIQNVQLIALVGHGHKADTGVVRRKGEVPILPPPKSPETSKKASSSVCGRGRCAVPLPPKYPRLLLMKPPDLGGGEPVSPPPVGVTKNAQPWSPLNKEKSRICRAAGQRQLTCTSNVTQKQIEAVDMHIERSQSVWTGNARVNTADRNKIH